ncbi:MAG: NADH-quinone oxidoreductase subunit C [Verrucomicrobia bacterium]|nr:NADH-quinone oxidoreductase subunit C [Verrucomicrobiota bacterium]
MNQPQTLEIITVDTLHEQTRALKEQGFRLVQISATQLPDQVELTYSFDRDSRLTNLRLNLPNGARLPSISGVFGCAVLYENEVHDLFGVPVDGLAIDFKGNFYKTAVKFPFGSTKAPCAAPAAGAPAPCAVEEVKK